MPNSFQFINKQTNEAEKFVTIDEKLCAFLGVRCDEARYYRGWYDGFGMCAAQGMSFQDMLEKVYHDSDDETKRMLVWFDENYRTTTWYSPH